MLFALASFSSRSAAQARPAHDLDSLSRALVAAINSSSPADRTSFLAKNLAGGVPAADRNEITALLDDLHDESGGLDIVRLEAIGRGRFITVRAHAYPRLALLNISPDRSEPSRLGVIELLKSWNPKTDSIAWPKQKLNDDRAVIDTIDRNLRTLSDADAFSGVVLIGKGDRVLLERAYGWANLEDSVRNTAESRFTIASIGKMFTAAAIGQLVAAGKLHFGDTLAKVLPEYPNADRAHQITIRELLGHTAGLGDLFGDSAYDRNRDYSSPLALASVVASRPLLFAPGTKWSYSNEGYVVLGAVIERVSGETYDDYLQRHVFAPAGMLHTGNFAADDVVPHRSVGYRHRATDPLGVKPPYGNRTFVRKGSPAGGAYTTARDLWQFTRALLDGRVLDSRVRDSLWVGRSPLPWDKTQLYGYGVIVSSEASRTVLGHGGGGSGSGIDNELRFFADGSYSVVVLANIDPPAASDLAPALIRFLAAQDRTPTKATDRAAGH
jgi:CubicO group peptidase (beta-lactamase class C family)